jgi:hypothetical protein
MTACTQPGCTGTIVDGYCDVCGSPAGAPAFAPAAAAASVGSSVPVDEPDLTAPPEPKDGGLMAACAQPGCSGGIVDGYCDVCGSPAGAPAFAPAAASVGSSVPVDEPDLTAPPEPKNGGLMAACAQPGCSGGIVDGYCDVCGSPADAVPFVTAASAEPPAPANEPRQTAVQASTPPPASVNAEIPTQRLPRVKMPRQQIAKQEMADPEAADPGVVDAQKVGGEKVDPAADDTEKVDGRKGLAEDESDGAEDYRTRVEEAQLPDDVREAALREVGKLERTSDQSPESGDIRTWLDTILDLPWSTTVTDLIDIQGSREVEATLRRLVESVVADVEEADTAEVESVVADVEEADTAEVESVVADVEEADTAEVEPAAPQIEKADTVPAGPQHDDTVEMPGVPALLSGDRHLRPQPPEHQVLGPEPVQTPPVKRRFASLALAATALAALLIGALLFASSRDGGVTAQSVPTVKATATATVSKPTGERSNESTGPGGAGPTIQLENLADSARPFQTVRIEGTYRGGPDIFLQVQRLEGRDWLSFPLPTKTDQSGQFTTYVELERPGRYWLRVVDPGSAVTSKPFVLVIEG